MAVIAFYPLSTHIKDGVLVVGGKAFPASFYTPREARALAKDGQR